MQQYESRYGAFPAAATGATSGEFEEAPRYNILAYILPYLELNYIADIFDMERDWNDTTNRKDELSAAELEIFKQRMGFTSNNFSVTNKRIAEQDAFQFLCPSAPARDDDMPHKVRKLFTIHMQQPITALPMQLTKIFIATTQTTTTTMGRNLPLEKACSL